MKEDASSHQQSLESSTLLAKLKINLNGGPRERRNNAHGRRNVATLRKQANQDKAIQDEKITV
jgi:hypothetical protein